MTPKDNPNLQRTMDAEIWTDEFMKAIKEHPEMTTNREALKEWFVDAIMSGFDGSMFFQDPNPFIPLYQ
jgi:hypothetical protein